MPDLGTIDASELEGKTLYYNADKIRQVVHATSSTQSPVYAEPGDLLVGEQTRELIGNLDFVKHRGNVWCQPVSFTKLDGKILACDGGFKRIKGNLEKAPFDVRGRRVNAPAATKQLPEKTEKKESKFSTTP